MRTVDPEILQRVAAQRERVEALEKALAPRRTAEAAELAQLTKELDDLQRRAAELPAETKRLEEASAKAEQERLALDAGLSAARRAWLRLAEPVVASLLLFFCLAVVGRVEGPAQRVLVPEGLALALGVTFSLLLRRGLGVRP